MKMNVQTLSDKLTKLRFEIDLDPRPSTGALLPDGFTGDPPNPINTEAFNRP